MPERLMADPSKLEPTLGICQPRRIAALRPFFQGGPAVLADLDPVVLLQDPDNPSKDAKQLVFDGNHRLTLGYQYQLLVPAVLFRIGEMVTIVDPHYEQFTFNEALGIILGSQKNLRRRGITSFEVLASAIDPAT